MKLKELHSLMQDMAPFDSDCLKVHLEQYPTGADLASRMLFTVRQKATQSTAQSCASPPT
jgi:predicted RNA methylase